MPGWVLVDNLRRPRRATRSAVRRWAGLRPMTPSLMPRVGAGSRPGVFYNTGHGHLGWTLSAATAQLVAEAVHHRVTRNDTSVAA